MTLDVSVEEADGYLLVRAAGEWTSDAVTQEIHRIVSVVEKRQYSRVLVDARGLSAPRTDLDRFLMGKDVAAFFAPNTKVASVYPREFINKFGENTAVNRGHGWPCSQSLTKHSTG